jgi:hypothetical protein
MNSPSDDASLAPQSSRKIFWLVSPLAAMALFYVFCGFYSVQPIGALPEGSTAIVWRNTGEPFFNSPDALCLERMGGVSLMCRGMAMSQAPIDRIVVRLPFIELAYLQSTDGQSFDR